MTSGVRPNQVLQLYRNLLRYSKQLTLTDKNYFRQRIQQEFRNNKTETSQDQIEFLFKKGLSLLEKKRVI